MQWDFMIYYYAGEAYNQGLNPYLLENLSAVSGESFWLHFAYPPVTLELFRFLPLLDFDTGHKVWLVLKIISMVILIFIWKRFFLKEISLFLIIPFMLFAFDSAVFWDLKSGNISIFEQLFLWLAFVAFLKDNNKLFIASILASSIFKFPMAFFMFLLLINGGDKKWYWLAGGMTCVAILAIANYMIKPDLFQSFLNNLHTLNERAEDFNYGMLAFWDDLYLTINDTARLPYRMSLVYASYGLTVISVLLISIRGYFKLRMKNEINLKIYTVLFFCLTYALIIPRFKCYSFIILIPAFLYIIISFRTYRYAYLIVPLGLIPVSTPLFKDEAITRIFQYYPLLLAFLIWWYFISLCYEPDHIDEKPDRVVDL